MSLLKSFSIYTVAAFCVQAVNFLLLPLFTHFLSPADFGILSILTTITAVISPLVMFSAEGAISVEYYKNVFNNFNVYITSCICISILSVSILTSLLLASGSFLSLFFNVPAFWLIILPFFSLLEGIKSIHLLIYRINRKAFYYALYSFGSVLLTIVLSVFLIIRFKYAYTGRLYGQYISTGVFFIFTCVYLTRQKYLSLQISSVMMKDAFKFGAPLVLHALGFVVINLADRFFISHYSGSSALGIYSLAYTIGSIISILALAFNNAWTPLLFGLLKEDTVSSRLKIVRVTYVFLIFLFLSTLILIFLTGFLFNLFIDRRFYGGAQIVPYIAMSSFFFGCYLAFTNLLFYLKKSTIFTITAVINIIFNLLLNYLLIPQLGIQGAAYATFISFFIFAAFIAFMAIRAFPELPWFALLNAQKR